MDLSDRHEDYLEAIALFTAEEGHAHAAKLAEYLDVTKPAVTTALQKLSEKGLIVYQKYHSITLTKTGKKIADEVVYRHQTLRRFLTRVLAIDDKEADSAACKLEHAVGAVVTQRLVEFTDFISRCPKECFHWEENIGYRCATPDDCEQCRECQMMWAKQADVDPSLVTLDQLVPGDKGTVTKLGCGLDYGRLAGMGLLAGAQIEMMKIAPLGDPVSLRIKTYELSLRKEQAVKILVKKESNDN